MPPHMTHHDPPKHELTFRHLWLIVDFGQIESKELLVDLIPVALVAEDELDLSQGLAERLDEIAKRFVRSL